jgi:alanine dehydrogenase
MIIGVIKEIKDKENRVALTPAGARTLTKEGHSVRLQSGGGTGAGFDDGQYEEAGAVIVDRSEAWESDLVLKVKEPLAEEYDFLRRQILFTFLHLSGVSRDLTEVLLQRNTTAIAYETVEDEQGRLPLLAPMSAVAGNMAVTIGSYYLARFNGGRGVQLGRVQGRKNGRVLILGDGVVGRHAAAVASAMGAQVSIAGRHPERQLELQQQIDQSILYIASTPESITASLGETDLLIGAVLRPGARAPYVVSESMVEQMQPGSVIVDVSIDQGGCVETSRPTSHSDPVYVKHGVIHYCVTNMPGAYPRTATIALTDATLPYIRFLVTNGVERLAKHRGLSRGVNTHKGFITYRQVAIDLRMEDRYKKFDEL